jgi:hypothetical protein
MSRCGRHFQPFLWSVKCNCFISKVTGYQTCWFSAEICICLLAAGALAALKRSTMNWSIKVRISLYIPQARRGCMTFQAIPLAVWGMLVNFSFLHAHRVHNMALSVLLKSHAHPWVKEKPWKFIYVASEVPFECNLSLCECWVGIQIITTQLRPFRITVSTAFLVLTDIRAE